MDIIELSWMQLSIGFLSLLIPAAILWWYKTGLNRQLTIATIRMTLQLIFVGYYLEYLFEFDNAWINLAWIMVMVVVADFATLGRADLKSTWSLAVPVFGATFIGIVLIDLFFLEFVIQLDTFLEAQYAIPITGMVLGNCLRSNVIGINDFYYNLKDNRERYRFFLASGASRSEALFPFFQRALKRSANPTLASMATIGLVSLPGMMTGQILSGSSPLTAIQYQIMIMLAIFSGTIFSVFLAIRFCNLTVFDRNDMPNTSIYKD